MQGAVPDPWNPSCAVVNGVVQALSDLPSCCPGLSGDQKCIGFDFKVVLQYCMRARETFMHTY
jgi:hypothetical protein